MPPKRTMESYQQSEGSESPTKEQESEFDTSWDNYYSFGGSRRGRESLRSQQGSTRSRSDESYRHHFVPPQYLVSSPDIRQSRTQFREEQNDSTSPQRRQQPSSSLSEPLLNRYNVPTHHDFDDGSLSTATTRDSSIEASMTSSERLNLFPSPMGSPVLHRAESIEMQAKRAAWAKPITEHEVMALRDDSSSKSFKGTELLLMFGDPEDTMSVMTGMSQQELIIKRRFQERKDKKYRRPKEKKKGGGVRILNLPVSLKGSPIKRKYHRGVADDDSAGDIEQAPAGKQKNRLSRYSSSRQRAVATADPGDEDADRRRAWRLVTSLTASRSEGLESSQSSLATSVGAATDTSKDDLLAQAAEDWIKSTEETGAAQFNAEDEDIRAKEDARELAAVLDQNSVSTNGSDDVRPTEEDGAFPSLCDARILFGPTRLSFDDEVADEAQWQDVSSIPCDSFVDTRTNWTGDKTSEESPVSVMTLPNRRVRQPGRATSRSQTRLLPPKESARRRPTSILRAGRHSGAKEVSAKIEAVKSARVKFHEKVVQVESKAQHQVDDPDESVGSCQSSESSGFAFTNNTRNDKVGDTMSPQDWTAFIEREASILSAIPESSDFLQTEPSESKPADGMKEINEFPEVPDDDREWALDDHERESFGSFGQFEAELPMDGGSTSEEENHDFMETVAAVVIQAAVRRMIATEFSEKMLIETSLEEIGSRHAYFSSEFDQQLGDESAEKKTYPSEADQCFGAFQSEHEHRVEGSKAKNGAPFDVAFPRGNEQDFTAFPSIEDKVLATRSPERQHDAVPGKQEQNPQRHVQNLASFPTAKEFPRQSHETSVAQREVQQHVPVVTRQGRGLEVIPSADDHELVESAATKAKRNFHILLSKYEQNLQTFSSMNEHGRESALIVPLKTKNEEMVVDSPSDGRHRNFRQEGTQTVSVKQERDLEILPSVDVQQNWTLTVNHERDLEIFPSANSLHHLTSPLVDEAPLEGVPYHMYDVAAIQIQSTFRGWWVRDSLNVDHYCACRIQREYRSFRERTSFVFDIYRIAIIQSLWRRKLAKRDLERLRKLASQRQAEKNRRLAARKEAGKVRRLAAQRDAERLRKKEAEEVEAKRRRELADQEEAEKLEADRIREVPAPKEAEELDAARLQEQTTREETGKLQKLEAQRVAEKARAERRRDEAAEKKAEEAGAEELRIEIATGDEAATRIQSQWRAFESRKECLNRLVSVLVLQGTARRWLAKKQISSNILEEASYPVKRAEEKNRWSPSQCDSIASDEAGHGFPEEAVPSVVNALERDALSESDERSEREKSKAETPIYRTPSEVEEGDEGEGDQKWVTVSHSYDEETFVQSYASKEKSGAMSSLESKDKAEVTNLSADELIELFIHTSMSFNKDKDRCITPLRMESPVGESPAGVRSAAQSVTSSAATSLVEEKPFVERPKFIGRPPRKEKSENANELLDREVLLAKEKVDRMNARLARANEWVEKF